MSSKSKYKKRIVKIGGILLIITMLIVGFRLWHRYRIANVFDQIYRDMGNNPAITNSLDRVSGWPSLYLGHPITISSGYYQSEYLQENQTLRVTFYNNDHFRGNRFTFYMAFPESNESIRMTTRYDANSRRLTIEAPMFFRYENNSPINLTRTPSKVVDFLDRHQLTWECIEEMYRWFLYDRILTDWFEENADRTRFSLDNLGRFRYFKWQNHWLEYEEATNDS